MAVLMAIGLVACAGAPDDDDDASRDDNDGGSGGGTVCPEPLTACGGDGTCADLTSDGEHCGACSRSCLGGACTAGTCAVVDLFDREETLDYLVANDKHVYAAHYVDTIFRTTLPSGAVETIPYLKGAMFAATSRGVYWADLDHSASTEVSFVDGETLRYFGIITGVATFFNALAAAGDRMYVAANGGIAMIEYNQAKVSLDTEFQMFTVGASSEFVLGSDSIRIHVFDPNLVVLGDMPSTDGSLAVCGSTGFLTTDESISRMDLTGTWAWTSIWQGAIDSIQIRTVCSDDSLYFVESGQLVRIGHDGGGAEVLEAGNIVDVAVNGTAVFWIVLRPDGRSVVRAQVR